MTYMTISPAPADNGGRTINRHLEKKGYAFLKKHCGRKMEVWREYTWGGTIAEPPVYGDTYYRCPECRTEIKKN